MLHRHVPGNVLPRIALGMCAALLFLPALALVHADPDDADWMSDPARGVLAAHRVKDMAAVTAIASARESDPWRLVDELLAVGEREAARAFAGRVTDPDALALRAYADGTAPKVPELRSSLVAIEAALVAWTPDVALEKLAALSDAPTAGVLAFRVALMEGNAHAFAGDGPSAADAFEAAASLGADLGIDLDAQADSLGQRFFPVLQEADLDATLRLLLVQYGSERASGELHGAAHAAGNVSAIYLHLGLPTRALPPLNHARALLRRLVSDKDVAPSSIRRDLAEVDRSRGQALGRLGDATAAIRAGTAAVEGFRQHGSSADLAWALQDVGSVFSEIGNVEEALRLYREAVRVLDEAPEEEEIDAATRAEARVNIGHGLTLLGRTRKGAALLREILDGGELGPQARVVALLNLQEAWAREGKFDAALAALEEIAADDIFDTHLRACVHLARVELLLRGPGETIDAAILAKAAASLEAARREAAASSSPALRMMLQVSQGEIELARGDAPAAWTSARRAAELAERLVTGMAEDDVLRSRAHRDRRRVSDLLAHAAVSTNDPARIFEGLERGRGRAFLYAADTATAPHEETEALRGARRALAETTLRLEDAAARLRLARWMDNFPVAQAARIDFERAEETFLASGRAVERELQTTRTAFAGDVPALTEARVALEPTHVLVSYALTESHAVATVVTKEEGLRVVRLKPTAELLDAISPSPRWRAQIRDAVVAPWWAALHAELIAPLGLSPTTTRVILSPDAGLGDVPWQAIVAEHTEAAVALVPSHGAWLRLRERMRSADAPALFVGNPTYSVPADADTYDLFRGRHRLDPLPGSELEYVAARRPGDATLTRDAATETAVTTALAAHPRFRVIHFGCHGLLHRRTDALTSLALSPDRESQGFLTALEIRQLQVQADLVVLSACSSALGDEVRGEAANGLVRAFLVSGSRCVLASAWNVDDASTGALMGRFYEELKKPDVTPSDALRTAMAFVRSHEKWKNQYYWAPWSVWGAP